MSSNESPKTQDSGQNTGTDFDKTQDPEHKTVRTDCKVQIPPGPFLFLFIHNSTYENNPAYRPGLLLRILRREEES